MSFKGFSDVQTILIKMKYMNIKSKLTKNYVIHLLNELSN